MTISCGKIRALWYIGKPNRWFRAYHKDITQFVSVGNYTSSARESFAGIPKDSVLGLFLLLLYTNDLQKCLKNNKAYIFADDTNITVTSKFL